MAGLLGWLEHRNLTSKLIQPTADALDVELSELIVTIQIPFAAAGILNAIIWAAVMILTAITFPDQPDNNASMLMNLSAAAFLSTMLIWVLSARYRRQSSTK